MIEVAGYPWFSGLESQIPPESEDEGETDKGDAGAESAQSSKSQCSVTISLVCPDGHCRQGGVTGCGKRRRVKGTRWLYVITKMAVGLEALGNVSKGPTPHFRSGEKLGPCSPWSQSMGGGAAYLASSR